MKFLKLEADKPVVVSILGFQPTTVTSAFGSRSGFEFCLRIDNELFSFITCSHQLMSALSSYVRNGYSTSGPYELLKTGHGVGTRYYVKPLHEPRITEPTKASLWQRLMDKIPFKLQWKTDVDS